MTVLAPRPLIAPLILAFRALQAALPKPARGHAAPVARAAKQGMVSLVGAGPGSADLITLRGLAQLKAADVVYYDRLADPALLSLTRPGAALVYVGKAPGCHAMPQDQINALMIAAARAGRRVVRLKCGDPGIFGRGAEEADALTAAGVAWDVIPGVTAASAAAASARSFLTARGQTERLIIATGHLRHDAAQDWASTAMPGTTLACYMGVAQAGVIADGLRAAGWPACSPVQVISRAQTPDEQVFTCTLDGLAALCRTHPGLNPAILLIRWPLDMGRSIPETHATQAIVD